MAVSGVKNSGKTTLIASILPLLVERGLKVAVIKHDGHSFAPETEKTDTARCLEAGAFGTAVFDGEKFKAVKYGRFNENDLIPLFPEADLILLEGFKSSKHPKLELVRRGVSCSPVCDPETLIALVTDLPIDIGVPVLYPRDAEGVADFIVNYIKTHHVGDNND